MQPFNQQPADKPETQDAGDVRGGEVGEIQQAFPIYEFPAGAGDSALQEPARAMPGIERVSEEAKAQPGSKKDMQQGLVYPPPPSFYQNMQVPLERPPLPPQQEPVNMRPPYSNYPPQTQAYPAGIQAPPFPPPYFPMMQPQPPAKRSYKWVWILVSIIGILFLVLCGLCSWAFYSIFNTTFQEMSGASDVVHSYYQHIQKQEYAAAYQDLQINGLTQEGFIQKAQQADAQSGTVLSFTEEQPSFSSDPNTGPNLSQWRITVDLRRNNVSYPVLLTVQKVDGGWKITYFDRI